MLEIGMGVGGRSIDWLLLGARADEDSGARDAVQHFSEDSVMDYVHSGRCSYSRLGKWEDRSYGVA